MDADTGAAERAQSPTLSAPSNRRGSRWRRLGLLALVLLIVAGVVYLGHACLVSRQRAEAQQARQRYEAAVAREDVAGLDRHGAEPWSEVRRLATTALHAYRKFEFRHAARNWRAATQALPEACRRASENRRLEIGRRLQDGARAVAARDWIAADNLVRQVWALDPTNRQAAELDLRVVAGLGTPAGVDALLASAAAAYGVSDLVPATRFVRQVLALEPGNQAALDLDRKIRAETTLVHLRSIRQQVSDMWTFARDFDRNQGVGGLIEAIAARLKECERLFDGRDYDQAFDEYAKALLDCERLYRTDACRRSANLARRSVHTARQEAEVAKASEFVPELWIGAEREATRASEAFEAGRFSDAVTAWRKAAGRFRKAETAARGSAAAQQARARYRTQIEGLDRAALGRVAGSHLRMALAADAAAEKALRDGQYDVAVRKWNQASALLGQAAARLPPASSPVP